MSTLLQPDLRRPLSAAPRAAARPPGRLLHWLVFGIGLTLPIISLSRTGRITTSLASRIEAVDVLCLLALVVLLFSGRLRAGWAWLVYGGSLVFSLAWGMTNGPFGTVFTAFAALAMASLYYCVARSIAPYESLVKALLVGLVISTSAEAIIVVHDLLLPKWFATTHADRVRGTFRSTAQLGGFGFTAAGLLLSFGWVYFRSTWARWAAMLTAVMGATFVLASTRRAGMFALLAWLALYLLMGLRQISRRSYWIVVGSSAVAMVALVAGMSIFTQTHVFERFNLALTQVTSGESFTHEQFYNAMRNLEMWFPLGIGVGLSPLVCVKHEAHNAHLGVLVEQGLLGALAYYALWVPLFRRKWNAGDFGNHTVVVKLVMMTFLAGAIVFMIHARLDRDRIFMLFLGLAPWVTCTAAETAQRGRAALGASRQFGAPWPAARLR